MKILRRTAMKHLRNVVREFLKEKQLKKNTSLESVINFIAEGPPYKNLAALGINRGDIRLIFQNLVEHYVLKEHVLYEAGLPEKLIALIDGMGGTKC